jgi:hypothetical protein
MGALALSLAGMLVDCGGGGNGNGGGGGGQIPLLRFFGMNGEGDCSNVVVNVDLAAANATLARDDAGTIACSLDPALISRGCNATFIELNTGAGLRVTINGCTIPATTGLFVCGFEEADLSLLTSESTAQCTCVVAGCDKTPPVCVGTASGPASCEDCDNRRDDDGNGLIDCADPNCENSPLCVSDVTTTTEQSNTTTTLSQEPISINFAMTTSSAAVGSLQFTANYTSAPGQFVGSGADVECVNKVTGAFFAANDKDAIRKLTLGFVSTVGFSAPIDLASCQFLPGTPVPVPHNFTIVIDDATDPDGNRVTPRIAVTVTGAP